MKKHFLGSPDWIAERPYEGEAQIMTPDQLEEGMSVELVQLGDEKSTRVSLVDIVALGCRYANPRHVGLACEVASSKLVVDNAFWMMVTPGYWDDPTALARSWDLRRVGVLPLVAYGWEFWVSDTILIRADVDFWTTT